MKNKFAENLSIKFVSVLIAFIIWISVINIIRPIVTDFVNIPISIVNEDAILKMNKAYTVKAPLHCKVTYKIDGEKSTMIRQSDFKAYVDLEDLLATGNLPIYVEAQNGVDKFVSNIQVTPKTLAVQLEDAKIVEFPIEYNISGTIDEGHSVGDVILSPNVVYVSGSDEFIKNIAHIAINIPVSDQAENFSDKASIYLIGADGKELPRTGMELSADSVNYSVSIFTRANVALNAIIDGEVKKGYYQEVIVSPSSIMLEGPRSVIENIYTIDLPAINVEGMSESIEESIKLSDVLPAGTRCSSVNEVKVNVNIDSNYIKEPTSKNSEGPESKNEE